MEKPFRSNNVFLGSNLGAVDTGPRLTPPTAPRGGASMKFCPSKGKPTDDPLAELLRAAVTLNPFAPELASQGTGPASGRVRPRFRLWAWSLICHLGQCSLSQSLRWLSGGPGKAPSHLWVPCGRGAWARLSSPGSCRPVPSPSTSNTCQPPLALRDTFIPPLVWETGRPKAVIAKVQSHLVPFFGSRVGPEVLRF